mmetsp:Transcript_123200/g.230310  ORF Transcript_123200/g.230310 Transcript_123200/m.230310 type:complete len:248 (-) Transcript_123200:299-1042(-)
MAALSHHCSAAFFSAAMRACTAAALSCARAIASSMACCTEAWASATKLPHFSTLTFASHCASASIRARSSSNDSALLNSVADLSFWAVFPHHSSAAFFSAAAASAAAWASTFLNAFCTAAWASPTNPSHSSTLNFSMAFTSASARAWSSRSASAFLDSNSDPIFTAASPHHSSAAFLSADSCARAAAAFASTWAIAFSIAFCTAAWASADKLAHSSAALFSLAIRSSLAFSSALTFANHCASASIRA